MISTGKIIQSFVGNFWKLIRFLRHLFLIYSTDGGGDLMKEILKEMKPTSGADPQEESIYSTLVRKGKKKRHQKSASVED